MGGWTKVTRQYGRVIRPDEVPDAALCGLQGGPDAVVPLFDKSYYSRTIWTDRKICRLPAGGGSENTSGIAAARGSHWNVINHKDP